jgi:hypothetical protein
MALDSCYIERRHGHAACVAGDVRESSTSELSLLSAPIGSDS